MKEQRKCWTCRKELKDSKKMFCKDCEKKDRKATAPTYIIFDKI